MHVRIKRENQTIFLYTNPGETIDTMKENISKIINVEKDKIVLYINDKPCVGQRTVSEYEVENDGIIYMRFKNGMTLKFIQTVLFSLQV